MLKEKEIINLEMVVTCYQEAKCARDAARLRIVEL